MASHTVARVPLRGGSHRLTSGCRVQVASDSVSGFDAELLDTGRSAQS